MSLLRTISVEMRDEYVSYRADTVVSAHVSAQELPLSRLATVPVETEIEHSKVVLPRSPHQVLTPWQRGC